MWLCNCRIYFSSFSILKIAAVHHVKLLKIKLKLFVTFWRPICITLPNFCKRLNGCRGMPIELFSQWRPSPMLDFDMQVLAVGAVSKPTLYRVQNCVKIDQTVAEISRFFWFSGWRLPPSWTFKNSNFIHVRCKGPMCVTLPNFVKIWLTAAEIWRFHGFFKMAAYRHLGFVGHILGPPTMTNWWSLSLCKTWLESMSNFEIMKFLIFCPFCLKTLILVPSKLGV